MPRADGHRPGLPVEGLYERIRAAELRVALSPDPRLSMITDPEEWGRAAAASPRFSPTVLSQTEALLAHEPVRLPRWLLGGVTCPEAKGWPVYEDRRHQWFTLTAGDVLTPAM